MKSLGKKQGVDCMTAVSKPIIQRRQYQLSCQRSIKYVGLELSGDTTDQLTCALPRPVSTYPGTWRVNCDCKRGWQPAICNRSNLLHMSPQAYPPLLALWRHQRIRLHHTLFTSYFSRRLPHSEPKPKKTNFRFFIKNRLKPNRV